MTATTTTTAVEVYEDNAGGLHLFIIAGDEIAWSVSYYGPDDIDRAAQDYVAIVVAGADPVADGWESDIADYGAHYAESAAGWPIAAMSSAAYDGSDLGVDVDRCGLAGLDFARALGVDVPGDED